MSRHQQGFTLVELMIVGALLTVLAVAGAPLVVSTYRGHLKDKTVGEIYTIQEAAQTYYVNHDGFPGGSSCGSALNVLRSNDYLIGIDSTSPWGSSYTTKCSGHDFKISVDMPSPYNSQALNLLVDAQVQGNTVTSSVPEPQYIPNKGDLLSRVKTGDPQDRTMEADLMLGGHNIKNIGDLDADTGDFGGRLESKSLLLTGGNLDTNGGRIDTGRGEILTRGGKILTNGGTVDTQGGALDLGGGDATNVDDIVMVNGVRLSSESNKTFQINANRTVVQNHLDVKGDADISGVLKVDDVVTDEGVRLSESLQDTDILKLHPSGGFSNRIPAPKCRSGSTPVVYAVPVRMGGGPAVNRVAPMGMFDARMIPYGSYYELRMKVVDTINHTEHDPPPGLDYALAVTRCVR